MAWPGVGARRRVVAAFEHAPVRQPQADRRRGGGGVEAEHDQAAALPAVLELELAIVAARGG